MHTGTAYCQNEYRRQKVRVHELNGLDYLEVSDDQLSLTVFFLDKAPQDLAKENIQIRGGQRICNIRVIDLDFNRTDDSELDDSMTVTVDKTGDFSDYSLCLIELDEDNKQTQLPHHEFDLRYSCLDFNFKVACPDDLDCKKLLLCPPTVLQQPEINYISKDYASFRQLLLDRLALLIPEWKERHVPDIGITLVEIFAYIGDHLSYYQDAVATEAYLETARLRVSIRRHARLVDYKMHEGCNARTWLHINTSIDYSLDVAKTYFITRHPDIPLDGKILTTNDLLPIADSGYEVFEPLLEREQTKINLAEAHNEIQFYTWGNTECCLPTGTVSATLIDEIIDGPVVEVDDSNDDVGPPIEPQRKLKLKVGDFLVFEELMGPKTGNPADADPAHRHIVRLTKVSYELDPVYEQAIVAISWQQRDALPFPLCISSQASDCTLLDKVSVARANIILVHHAKRELDLSLGTVPVKPTDPVCPDQCDSAESSIVAAKFQPQLQQSRLSFSQPLPNNAAASQLLQQDPRQALPVVQLTGKRNTTNGVIEELWLPQFDLLQSYFDDNYFVVEMDDYRQATIRFGDGESGRRPPANTEFSARYSTGNGTRGNVGANVINHVIQRQTTISGLQLRVHNPLPVTSGIDPELKSEVKQFAPQAFRETLQRAITAEDYAQIVMRDFPIEVQRAAASLRWTGSWYEVLVAIDPLSNENKDLLTRISGHLHRYKRIGHDLRIALAQYVALDIELDICVAEDYLRGHVKAELLKLFSNSALVDGRLGFFHPDNLTFGDGIYLSQLVATAQGVIGVESVTVTKLQRLYEDNSQIAITQGVLTLGPLEVARLDNDRSFPENGKLFLNLRGGR